MTEPILENKLEQVEVSNEEAMLEMLGYLTVHRDGLKELGFNEKDANAISRGIKRALKDEVMDPLYQERMEEFQAFIEKGSKKRNYTRTNASCQARG